MDQEQIATYDDEHDRRHDTDISAPPPDSASPHSRPACLLSGVALDLPRYPDCAHQRPPFFQMETRFLTAGILLTTWVLVKKHKLPTRREWRNALITGALMLGGGMGLTASAEVHVGSGMIAAFIAVVPMLMSALGASLGQRPGRQELLGMNVGLAGSFYGCVALVLQRHPSGWHALPGHRCCGHWAPCCPPHGYRWPLDRQALPAKCCVEASC